jgi:hypothetical protein
MREEVQNNFKLVEMRDEKYQGHETSRVDSRSMANYRVYYCFVFTSHGEDIHLRVGFSSL